MRNAILKGVSCALAIGGAVMTATQANALALRVITDSSDLVIQEGSPLDTSAGGDELIYSGSADGYDIEAHLYAPYIIPRDPWFGYCCEMMGIDVTVTSTGATGPVRLFAWEDDFRRGDLQNDIVNVLFGTSSDQVYLYRTFLDFSGTDWTTQTTPNDVFNAPITQSLTGIGPVAPTQNQSALPEVIRTSGLTPFTVGFEIIANHSTPGQVTEVTGYNEPVGTVPLPAPLALLSGGLALLGLYGRRWSIR